MKIFGRGFHFSEDGPGNRLVYHLAGCNMRCPWCSNPEGMDGKTGQSYTVDEIVDECVRSRAMFFEGGGVTFTGGEATLWHAELSEVLMRLREHGIHTAIETNATSPHLCELSPWIDYLIMDFKHYDDGALMHFTGVDGKRIRENFERLCRERKQLHVRIPLIHGVNDDSPECFAAYFAAQDTSHCVFEFLPYHEYGKGKWKTPYLIENGFITPEALESFIHTFRRYGLTVIKT